MTLRFLLVPVLLLALTTAALAGDSVRLSLPKGFCLLDSQKSEKEAELQRLEEHAREQFPGGEVLATFYECEALELLRSKGAATHRGIIGIGRLRATEDSIRGVVNDPGFRKSYFEVPIERYGLISTEKSQAFFKEFESSEEFDEKRNLGVYSIDKDNMSFSYIVMSGEKSDGKSKLRAHLRSSVLIEDRVYAIASEIFLRKRADIEHFWDIHDDFVKSFIRSNRPESASAN